MEIARLIYGSTAAESSYRNSDLLWRIQMWLHDPHFFVEWGLGAEEGVLIASSLELNRAKREIKNAEVVSVDELRREVKDGEEYGYVKAFLRRKNVSKVIVHPDTPIEIVQSIESAFSVEVGARPWYPERITKTPEEVLHIKDSIRAIEEALLFLQEEIRGASVRDGVLYKGREPLTSEYLRALVEEDFFKKGFLADGTIISSGRDAAYPHSIGRGALAAASPIVCDIFPYSRRTGYYADVTRTFFKGAPPRHIKKAYEVVLRAQMRGISLIRVGASGARIHRQVSEVIREEGFITDPEKGAGFIHSTGHGVGLECHELISIGGGEARLPEGAVITVEPGLYYPEENFGIRIEDMVLVRASGPEVLTHFPKELSQVILP